MKRRTLLKAVLGMGTLSTAKISLAGTYSPIEYSPDAFKAAMDSGEPLLLGFHASGCSTCRSQERQISALMDANPDYANVQVMSVDWDQYRSSDFTKNLKIPRRSTLVMFKGGEEVGRVIAQTGQAAIEELFKAAA